LQLRSDKIMDVFLMVFLQLMLDKITLDHIHIFVTMLKKNSFLVLKP